MPAESDLLCEYYLSSNLNCRKLSEPSASIHNKLNNIGNKSNDFFMKSISTSSFSTNSSIFEPIEFVKYDKNPMDSLKSKYKLLSTTNTNLTLNEKTFDSQAADKINTELKTQQLPKNPTLLDSDWSKIKKIGIGLLNLGNNCYLNATLQCLAYTPPLSQWLVSKPHSPLCKFKQQKGFCSLCEVEKIICDIFNSCNGCAKPNTLCFNIKKISNVFGVGRQEDASEFFTTLLESMIKSINFANNLNGVSKKLSNEINSRNKRSNTVLDEIFSFQFRSRVTCCNCGRLSDTIEQTNTWPVDVKYVQDLRKGMLHFLREEVLDGENAYKCDKCNKKTRATKKYSIRTAPNILVVHLKRFDFSYAGKLSHFVAYPEILSLKTLVPDATLLNTNNLNCSDSKSLKNVQYKLYGVLVHLGYTSRSGHYYSYVRGPNEVWYKADDTRISTVQSKDALGQNAYILFYNKIKATNSNQLSEQQQQPILKHNKTLATINGKIKNINTNGKNIPVLIKTNECLQKILNGDAKSSNIINNKCVENQMETCQKEDKDKEEELNTNQTDENKVIKKKKLTKEEKLMKKLKKKKELKRLKKKKLKKSLLAESLKCENKNETDKDEKQEQNILINKKNETSLNTLSKLERKKLKKLKKKLKDEKKLKKLKKKKLLKSDEKQSETSQQVLDDSNKLINQPVEKNLKKSPYQPYQIIKTSDLSSNGDILNHLKEKNQLKTWNNELSLLHLNSNKKKKIVRDNYDEDDDIPIDVDEYNEDFDKPQIKEKKPKFLLKKKQSMNGFHKFMHESNGQSSSFNNKSFKKFDNKRNFNEKNKFNGKKATNKNFRKF